MKEINLKNLCQAERACRKAAKDVRIVSEQSRYEESIGRHSERTAQALEIANDWHSETIHALANHADREKLSAILDDVQKRCSARLITDMDIIKSLLSVEDMLEIPKVAMEYLRVTVDVNSQKFPNAYNGIPESTLFTARYTHGHWTLEKVWRGPTRSPLQAVHIEHTEKSKAALLARFTNFSI